MDVFFDRIAPLIIQARNALVTDAEMEREMGLPAHSINKWFTGKYKSYKNYLRQIAKYFHVSVDYLIGETDDKTPVPTNEDGLSEKQRELIQLVRSLPPAEVDYLLATAMLQIEHRKFRG